MTPRSAAVESVGIAYGTAGLFFGIFLAVFVFAILNAPGVELGGPSSSDADKRRSLAFLADAASKVSREEPIEDAGTLDFVRGIAVAMEQAEKRATILAALSSVGAASPADFPAAAVVLDEMDVALEEPSSTKNSSVRSQNPSPGFVSTPRPSPRNTPRGNSSSTVSCKTNAK